MKREKESYTAIGNFPIKIFLDKDLMRSLEKQKIIQPIHVMLNPTNQCNLNCHYCSCGTRNKNVEMPFKKIIAVMKKFKKLGCKSATIIGGGEPLMHPDINTILQAIQAMGIEIGLVTNGTILDKLTQGSLDTITWCRVSLAGHRNFEKIEKSLRETVEKNKKIDWAFSFVVEKELNIPLIHKMIKFANKYNFTHVRLVNDIFIADELDGQMKIIKDSLEKFNIDDNKIIYQDRATWNKGNKECRINLLKPIIAANGNIYPCCGSQYMFENSKRDYEGKIGTVDEIEEIWEEQRYFNGSQCSKCYYSYYNELLELLLTNIKHKKFI